MPLESAAVRACAAPALILRQGEVNGNKLGNAVYLCSAYLRHRGESEIARRLIIHQTKAASMQAVAFDREMPRRIC